MIISTKEYNDKVIIELEGEIQIKNISEIKKVIYQTIDTHKKNIILDFKNVSYIDSSGIGVLLVGYRKASESGNELILCNVPEKIMEILKLTQINRIFRFFTSEDLKN